MTIHDFGKALPFISYFLQHFETSKYYIAMPSDNKEEKTVTISVESDKPKDKNKNKNSKKDDKDKPEEISEEDLALKEGLELAVLRLQEKDASLHAQALNHLSYEIRTATASMTSVPKPLKFLHPHYNSLKAVYESWHAAHDMKQSMADMLSVLAMTMSTPGYLECLKFKLQGTSVDIASWGHEYVRFLAGEISEEYNRRLIDAPSEDESQMEDLMCLVDDMLPYQMTHNAESEAVDLLMEVQQLSKLIDCSVIDERNYERVCLYLLRSADFMSDPDDLLEIYYTAYIIYKNQNKFTDALRVALKLDDINKINDLFSNEIIQTSSNLNSRPATELEMKQMAFILGRQKHNYECENMEINEIIGNEKLSERFLSVAKDMDVVEPRTPDDIYKTNASSGSSRSRAGGLSRANATMVDSARGNLASTFVNAFVNIGYCNDKLMLSDNCQWIYKNKDHGMLSAAASLGMILQWNVEGGLNEIDRFFHNTDDYIKAGGCLALGILSSGVRNESDPAIALLTEYLEYNNHNVRACAISGLGIAYTNSQRMELKDILFPILSNTDNANIIEVSFASLSLGLIFIGTCDEDISTTIAQRLMEATTEELNHTMSRFLILGLGLLFLGKNERVDAILEVIRTIEHPKMKYAEITLITCAYAGSGNVLKVQEMLHICAEHPPVVVDAAAATPAPAGGPSKAASAAAAPTPVVDTTPNRMSDYQAVAVLGIALLTVGEDIGREMSLRTFDHLLQYGSIFVKRIVPLALSLLYVSNPDYTVVDQLSRLSHDQDVHVAQSAIFSLGVVSAGTNNSRIGGILRQLSEFYSKEGNHLFMVRLAQGLNAMGKGLITLNAYHSDR